MSVPLLFAGASVGAVAFLYVASSLSFDASHPLVTKGPEGKRFWRLAYYKPAWRLRGESRTEAFATEEQAENYKPRFD